MSCETNQYNYKTFDKSNYLYGIESNILESTPKAQCIPARNRVLFFALDSESVCRSRDSAEEETITTTTTCFRSSFKHRASLQKNKTKR